MDHAWAHDFVDDWVGAWNDHDLDRLLGHFAADAVFTSPVAARVVAGSDGTLRGIEALRSYWRAGLELIPDLHFDVIDFYVGLTTIVINYRNQLGKSVCEVLSFDGPLVVQGHGTYLGDEANPAGVRSNQIEPDQAGSS